MSDRAADRNRAEHEKQAASFKLRHYLISILVERT